MSLDPGGGLPRPPPCPRVFFRGQPATSLRRKSPPVEAPFPGSPGGTTFDPFGTCIASGGRAAPGTAAIHSALAGFHRGTLGSDVVSPAITGPLAPGSELTGSAAPAQRLPALRLPAGLQPVSVAPIPIPPLPVSSLPEILPPVSPTPLLAQPLPVWLPPVPLQLAFVASRPAPLVPDPPPAEASLSP